MYSIIENNFIQSLKKINSDIDPDIFISTYHTYSNEYFMFYETYMKKLYTYLVQECPSVDFSLTGRLKAKPSYFTKTLLYLKDNLDLFFPNLKTIYHQNGLRENRNKSTKDKEAYEKFLQDKEAKKKKIFWFLHDKYISDILSQEKDPLIIQQLMDQLNTCCAKLSLPNKNLNVYSLLTRIKQNPELFALDDYSLLVSTLEKSEQQSSYTKIMNLMEHFDENEFVMKKDRIKEFLELNGFDVSHLENSIDSLLSSFHTDQEQESIEQLINDLGDQSSVSYSLLSSLLYSYSLQEQQYKFSKMINSLSPDLSKKLVEHFGRTEDLFAHRPVIRSIHFPLTDVSYEEGKLYCYNTDGKKQIVHSAFSFSPEDIKTKENHVKYIMIDGKEQILNERDLLYSSELSSQQRKFENAKKDENGHLTLLRDAIQSTDLETNCQTFFNVLQIYHDKNSNSISIEDEDGNLHDISSLVHDPKHQIEVYQYDEPSLIKAIYHLENLEEDFYKKHGIVHISRKRKDYIAMPKLNGYQSLHDSIFYPMRRLGNKSSTKSEFKQSGFAMESQKRTLLMNDMAEDDSTTMGHDFHKKNRYQEFANSATNDDILALINTPGVNLSDVLGRVITVFKKADEEIGTYTFNPKELYQILYGQPYDNLDEMSNPFSDDEFSVSELVDDESFMI